MDYFTADPHLSHSNIIKFERTQFLTIEEHDEFVKNAIKSQVSKSDNLYILGDVGELSSDNILYWRSLPCKTILIRGNHDNQKQKCLEAFDVVSDVPIFYRKRVLLSHEPLPVTNETINLHGHLHNSHLNRSNYVNLSIHVADYKLMNSKQVDKMIATTSKMSQHFMYEWYAKDYVFDGCHDDVIYREGQIDIFKTRKQLFNKNPMKRIRDNVIDKIKVKRPDLDSDVLQKLVESYVMLNYSDNSNFSIDDVIKFISKRKE